MLFNVPNASWYKNILSYFLTYDKILINYTKKHIYLQEKLTMDSLSIFCFLSEIDVNLNSST
jgi:hypothetical protein